jgi:hypothetical protein
MKWTTFTLEVVWPSGPGDESMPDVTLFSAQTDAAFERGKAPEPNYTYELVADPSTGCYAGVE